MRKRSPIGGTGLEGERLDQLAAAGAFPRLVSGTDEAAVLRARDHDNLDHAVGSTSHHDPNRDLVGRYLNCHHQSNELGVALVTRRR